MSTFWYYIKHLYFKFVRDDAFFLASGVAFNLLICLIPIILILFSVVGFTLSTSVNLWDKTVLYLESLIPISSERIVDNTQALIRDRRWMGIVGLVTIAFTATRLFASVRTVLDMVFEVKHVRGIIHGKIFDFAILMLLGIMMILANIAINFLSRLERFGILFSGNIYTFQALIGCQFLSLVLPLVLTLTIIFFSYKLFPSQSIKTGTCLIATVIAGVFWEITKELYVYYLILAPGFNRLYGTLAAMVAIIVWFYLSSLVYVVGAEIAFIHEKRHAAPH